MKTTYIFDRPTDRLFRRAVLTFFISFFVRSFVTFCYYVHLKMNVSCKEFAHYK